HFLGHLKKHDLEQMAGQTILDLTISDDGDEVPVKGFSFPSYVDFSRMSLPPVLLRLNAAVIWTSVHTLSFTVRGTRGKCNLGLRDGTREMK
ncbi:hypothetical protein P5673_010360, partial [Acropora cervicornis]